MPSITPECNLIVVKSLKDLPEEIQKAQENDTGVMEFETIKWYYYIYEQDSSWFHNGISFHNIGLVKVCTISSKTIFIRYVSGAYLLKRPPCQNIHFCYQTQGHLKADFVPKG